jgi:glycosyltransferase involved in cell wall biosynthesis
MDKLNSPLVSVIIPCYNLGRYLSEAVASVDAQTFTNYEIIIVDDGSTDAKTKQVLDEFKQKPLTIIINPHATSASSARNTGIKQARGQYICCLDADDKLAPTYLAKTVTVLQRDRQKKIGIVAPDYKFFGNQCDRQRVIEYDPVALAVGNTLQVASLFRRECWQQVGGYSTNLKGYEDWDFWLKIVGAGYEWATLHEPLIYYRRRRNSKVNTSKRNHVHLTHTIVDNNAAFYQRYDVEIIKLFFIAQNDQLFSKLAWVRQKLAKFKH